LRKLYAWLYLRREDYDLGIVPAKASLLVAGVDVQDDRLEVEIKAYGRGKESWSVDYRVIQVPDQAGQALKTSSPEVWQELEALLAADWPRESGGTVPIMAMTIDTGFRPQMVYEFAARHPQPAHGPAGDRISVARTVVATKGTPDFLKLIARVSPTDAARKRQNVRIWHIGTHWAKQEFYDWLRIALPDDGTYGAFTYNAPNDDGTGTTAFTCRFANEPLSWEMVADLACSIGITLIENPSSTREYALNGTVTRFPSQALQDALLSQVQQVIPLIKIQPLEAGYPAIYLSDHVARSAGDSTRRD
jgi:hypothetical protein